MRGMNTVFLVGRAGQDPEIRTSKAGKPWCSLSMATHRNVRGDDGEFVEHTDWHDVRLFGEQASEARRLVSKGIKIAVEGTLTYDTWVDDAGNNRKSTRVLCNSLNVVGEPRPAAIAEAAADPARKAPAPEEAPAPMADAA